MIRQYLLNKNESATVPKTKKILELNKALDPNFFLDFDTVAILFLFGKYYSIIK